MKLDELNAIPTCDTSSCHLKHRRNLVMGGSHEIRAHRRSDLRLEPSLFAIVLAFLIASVGSSPSAQIPAGDLVVSSFVSNTILRYNRDSGAFIEILAQSDAVIGPGGLAFDPTGHLLYVVGQGSHNVGRFDAHTGELIDEIVPSGSGGLSFPTGLAIGPDGHLYVASLGTHQVLHYHGETGAFLDAFVPAGSGGLNDPTGLVFGPGGNLYVASGLTNSVLRYAGSTGSFIDAFVTAGSGGLSLPTFLAFRPGPNVIFFTTGQDTQRRAGVG